MLHLGGARTISSARVCCSSACTARALGSSARRRAKGSLALQVQEMRLGQQRAGSDGPTAQDVRDLVGDERVVSRGVAAFDHGPDARGDGFLRVIARCRQERRQGRAIAGARQAERALLGFEQEPRKVQRNAVCGRKYFSDLASSALVATLAMAMLSDA